ncbi:LysR family transcriptional regulator [Vreelandella populi]|uniref:LysR family transcriptional regulator n=1 Tax=Vreelandella populi TaxID=2498858 RepID=A0A3S0ZG85_9GAMM|nr:LysR family transcriptional regulator [Halomonas populi]RUR37859.1 LysR family transcriptional regulator [Halomonas populi]RUR48768.1 LysR family transcriptional regulator [Halomonas populi]
MYDFDELNAFSNVMATGSLTRSAQAMGLAKSTLSRRISQLENRLDQPLLRRQANRLIPTEAGLLFHTYCQELLALAANSQEALAELKEEISGQLTLKVHTSLTRGWASEVINAFIQRYSHIELTLQTLDALPTSPDSHCVHVWLGELGECGLHQEPVGELHRGLYTSPTYRDGASLPQHPDELCQHDWVDLLGTTQGGLPLHHADKESFVFHPPRSRLRVDLAMLHMDAIARGQGIGVLSHWLVEQREHHHPGDLIACLPEWSPAAMPITLLYAYGHQPRRVHALLDFLRNSIPDEWKNQHANYLGHSLASKVAN